jgi:hypothetical protein
VAKEKRHEDTGLRAMPLETFRSRDTISAVYFDGSLESALEVARLFPSQLQIEFTGGNDFLLRATNQAAFVSAHAWVYKNGSSRVEWRDHEELTKKWEPGPGVEIKRYQAKQKSKGKTK